MKTDYSILLKIIVFVSVCIVIASVENINIFFSVKFPITHAQYLEGGRQIEMTGLVFSFPVLNVLWDMVAGHTFSRSADPAAILLVS